MDIGPTVLKRASVEVPSYFEGRSLCHYIDGNHEDLPAQEYVYAEDNYQIMMRGHRYKLVYYIGQQAGEMYDLNEDPNELQNLWDHEDYTVLQAELKERLLRVVSYE